MLESSDNAMTCLNFSKDPYAFITEIDGIYFTNLFIRLGSRDLPSRHPSRGM